MQHSSLRATLLLTVVFCVSGVAAQGVEQTHRTIEVDGIEREYLLLIPENPNGDPRALVFNLHGSGGNPEQQLRVSDFARLAAEHEFLAALPQGIYQNTRSRRSWNADSPPYWVAGVEDSIARWVAANGCSEAERLEAARTILHERWTRCAADVAVEAYIIADGGHTWPGASLGQQIDASELIWTFFTRYRRATAGSAVLPRNFAAPQTVVAERRPRPAQPFEQGKAQP